MGRLRVSIKNSFMLTKQEQEIAMCVWRSGFFPEKNKLRQDGKIRALSLVASNLIGYLKTTQKDFDEKGFLSACGINA